MNSTPMKLLIAGIVILLCVGCKPNDDPVARHAEALAIVKRLAARTAEHPMNTDLMLSRDDHVDHKTRTDAMARTKLNCDDLTKLRSLIDVGRPLGDYAPIEKIGQFWGKDPYRYFQCGLTGFVNSQGPEPYSISINLDASNVIVKVGPIVMKH